MTLLQIKAIYTRLHLWSRSPHGSRVILTTNVLLLCGSIALLLLLGRLYGTRYTLTWDDETIFTDIAQEFASHGVLGAPSFQGNGLHMDEKTYYYPPLYPLTLAAWFRLFPPTLQSARLLSNVLAAGCLAIVFLLAQSLRRNSLFAGIMVLGLAIDNQFARMYTQARPDTFALTLSLLSVLTYFRSMVSEKTVSLAWFSLSWTIASSAMLTHPIGGMISFLTIPSHLMLTAPRELQKPKFWIFFIGIPIIAVSLWGTYIIQDIPTFKAQFVDWQMARKAYTLTEFLRILPYTLLNLNYWFPMASLQKIISIGVIVLVGLKSAEEVDPKRPALLLLFLVLASAFAVNYGSEMMYPPLKRPALYLGLFLCAEWIPKTLSFPRVVNTRSGIFRLSYSIVIALSLFLVIAKSSLATLKLLQEIRYSERAEAYDPATLAKNIIRITEANRSIAVNVEPDCFDILANSGHFNRVRKLSWFNLTKSEYLRYVCSNEYLVITDTVLQPNPTKPSLMNLNDAMWGPGRLPYRQIAEQFYNLKEVIVLTGGGETRLYKRDHKRDVEATN